mmetsp:Transcript_65104/g.153217  ORF Transcript_65104/g.153217 Transcript_65104/m.153217 type:complete len:226 (-) Transcript_65104:693-1370(-)
MLPPHSIQRQLLRLGTPAAAAGTRTCKQHSRRETWHGGLPRRREGLSCEDRHLSTSSLHQAAKGVPAPGREDVGPLLLHELMPTRKVVQTHWGLGKPLPSRRLGPGRHRVTGPAKQLHPDRGRQATALKPRLAQTPLRPGVNLQVCSKQGDDMFPELRRSRRFRWREGVGRELFVGHVDAVHHGWIWRWRLPTRHIHSQRGRCTSHGREPQGELHGQSPAHGEAH